MKKIKENIWVVGALGGIVLSLLSLLLPVLTYTTAAGTPYRYSLPGILRNIDAFLGRVFDDYTGNFLRGISYTTVSVITLVLIVLAVCAIVLSFVGLITLSRQYSNRKSYLLSICGLVGTAIPAVVLLILVLLSGHYFKGTIRCGLYEYITPLTMLLSCRAVTYKHKAGVEQLQAEIKARQYVYHPKDF